MTAGGSVRFRVHATDLNFLTETDQFDITTAETIHDGTWHHVACVRDGETGRIFIDGVESVSGQWSCFGFRCRFLHGGRLRRVRQLGLSGSHGGRCAGLCRSPRGLATRQDRRRTQSRHHRSFHAHRRHSARRGIVVRGGRERPGRTGAVDHHGRRSAGPEPWFSVRPPPRKPRHCFRQTGTYVLRATASDGVDDVSATITVLAGSTASSPFAGLAYGAGTSGSFIPICCPMSMRSRERPPAFPMARPKMAFICQASRSPETSICERGFPRLWTTALANPWGMAGMVVRVGTAGQADEAGAFIGYDSPAGDGTWIRRATAAAANVETTYPGMPLPRWCRMTRTGGHRGVLALVRMAFHGRRAAR